MQIIEAAVWAAQSCEMSSFWDRYRSKMLNKLPLELSDTINIQFKSKQLLTSGESHTSLLLLQRESREWRGRTLRSRQDFGTTRRVIECERATAGFPTSHQTRDSTENWALEVQNATWWRVVDHRDHGPDGVQSRDRSRLSWIWLRNLFSR
jgi:hypothetical protein